MTCKRVKTTHARGIKILVVSWVTEVCMVAYHRDNNKNITRPLNMANGTDKLLVMKVVAR